MIGLQGMWELSKCRLCSSLMGILEGQRVSNPVQAAMSSIYDGPPADTLNAVTDGWNMKTSEGMRQLWHAV